MYIIYDTIYLYAHLFYKYVEIVNVFFPPLFLDTIFFVHAHEYDFEIVVCDIKILAREYLSFEWYIMREEQLARDVPFEWCMHTNPYLNICMYVYAGICIYYASGFSFLRLRYQNILEMWGSDKILNRRSFHLEITCVIQVVYINLYVWFRFCI